MRVGLVASVLLGTMVAACSAATEAASESDEVRSAHAFANDFVFGSAIAGFQVDMGCPNVAAETCEDRNSDWYQYITTDRITANPLLYMSGDAPATGPGFYETYADDIARAKGELGNDALRLSIEWSRIFPNATWGIEGQDALRAVASADGIAYYHRIFAAMKAKGMKPSVTLNHYTLPLWVHDGNFCNQDLAGCIAAGKGGWADPNRSRIVNEVAKYAGFVAKEFGGEVDTWATMNEPLSAVVLPGYLVPTQSRSAPPGLYLQVDAAKTATLALIEAHARMYDAVKANDTVSAYGGNPADVGIVYAFENIVPQTDSDADKTAAEHANYVFQDMFMDAIVFGRVDETWSLGPGVPPVRPEIAGRIDFVGVNYYFQFTARAGMPADFISPFLNFDPLAPLEAVPEGIQPTLERIAKRYGKPIVVTETGAVQAPGDPGKGAAWVVKTLEAVKSAIDDGADVRGYFTWTLMDNYEWNQGTHTKMGLYSVDPTTKARSLREAGGVYASIVHDRSVSPALSQHYARY